MAGVAGRRGRQPRTMQDTIDPPSELSGGTDSPHRSEPPASTRSPSDSSVTSNNSPAASNDSSTRLSADGRRLATAFAWGSPFTALVAARRDAHRDRPPRRLPDSRSGGRRARHPRGVQRRPRRRRGHGRRVDAESGAGCPSLRGPTDDRCRACLRISCRSRGDGRTARARAHPAPRCVLGRVRL